MWPFSFHIKLVFLLVLLTVHSTPFIGTYNWYCDVQSCGNSCEPESESPLLAINFLWN